MRSNPVEYPIPGADPTEVQICLSLTGSARNNGRYDASAVNDPGLPVRALARAISVPSHYYPPLYPSFAELHDLMEVRQFSSPFPKKEKGYLYWVLVTLTQQLVVLPMNQCG